MAKPMDPKMNPVEGDMDPFADPPDGTGAPGGDPFDFTDDPPSSAPRPEGSAKGVKPPRRASPPLPAASSHPASTPAPDSRAMGLMADVPVQVVAVLGKKAATVREIVSLKKGQVIELNRFPNEAVDLVANGKLVAKGELVEIDGKLGVRIIKIFE